MPEGKKFAAGERSQAAWHSILSSAAQNQLKTGLVVAHDATNKALLCQIRMEADHFWNFRQGNGAVSVIDYP